MIVSRWVRGWVLFAALPLAGCGGWVDVDTAGSGGTSGAGGRWGATGGSTGSSGAPTQVPAGYGFYVIPGSLQAGDNAADFDSRARLVSENGSLVVGTTSVAPAPSPGLPRGADDQVYHGELRYFYWTSASGTQPWEGHTPSCLSGDGSAIFSTAGVSEDGDTLSFTRWTSEGGFQDLGASGSYEAAGMGWCSYDGQRAGGSFWKRAPVKSTSDIRAVLWADGRWDNQVNPVLPTSEVPDGAFGWVSPVGSVSIVTSYGSPNHIYWADGDAALELLVQPGSCIAQPASRDGKVVVSFCEVEDGFEVYRWTADTREFARMGELGWPDHANVKSADGSALAASSGNQLAYLKDGTTTVATADGDLSVLGVSDDGSQVYLQQGSQALRWSEATGFVALEPLSELPCTLLSYPGSEGPRFPEGLAVGLSSAASDDASELVPSECAWARSRAVLWDSRGVRDIQAELTAAGVDLQGVELHRADRVWSTSGVRIMGTGNLASGALRTWIAELPARE